MGSWPRLARVRAPAGRSHLVPPGISFTGRIDGGTAEAVRWEREGAAARPVVAPARLWRDADGRPHLRWL